MSKLNILPGNRREIYRTETADQSEELTLFVDGMNIGRAKFTFIELGSFGLICSLDKSIGSPGLKAVQLLSQSETVVLNGDWKFLNERIEDGIKVLVFEHPNRKIFTKFSESISPKTTFHVSRHRVLFLEQDKDEIGRLITSIKDLPFKLLCRGSVRNDHFPMTLDFESGAAVLDTFEFSLPKQVEIGIGDEIAIEFNFLSIRYLFISTVLEIDRVFDLLSVSIPENFLTTNGRNYDRWPADIECELFIADSRYKGVVTELSPTGCFVFTEFKALKKDEHVTLRIPAIDALFQCQIRSIRSLKIGLAFTQCVRSDLARLASLSIVPPLVSRKKSEYDEFLKLHFEVGYLQKEQHSNRKEVESIFKVWETQDSELPGSTLGSRNDEGLIASLGVIPVSANSIYAHSLAMKKSLVSISTVSELLSRSFWWAEFLGDLKYYIGAAKTKSKFSTRLLTTFDAQPHLENIAFDALKIALRDGFHDGLAEPEYRLLEVKICDVDLRRRNKLFGSMCVSSEFLSDLHGIKIYSVQSRDGQIAGYLIHHFAKPGHTASNIFNTAIYFGIDNEPILNLQHLIFSTSRLIPTPDSLEVVKSGIEVPKGFELNAIIKHWYVIEKNDFAAVLPSISKVLFSVIRKYGEEAIDHLRRAV
jgi:hypothetical protein